MGIIKFFRDEDIYNDNQYKSTEKVIEKIVRINSTPDSSKFTIIKEYLINNYSILLIRYDDVDNFEGQKILMYPKFFDLNLLKNKNKIDPHFSTDGFSPIARFEPTEYGLKLAFTLAKNLD